MENNIDSLSKEQQTLDEIVSKIEDKIALVKNSLEKIQQERVSYLTKLSKIKSKIQDLKLQMLLEDGRNGKLEKCDKKNELKDKYPILWDYWYHEFVNGKTAESEHKYCWGCSGDPIDGCSGCQVRNDAWEDFKKMYNL